jgi:hypothetical protein
MRGATFITVSVSNTVQGLCNFSSSSMDHCKSYSQYVPVEPSHTNTHQVNRTSIHEGATIFSEVLATLLFTITPSKGSALRARPSRSSESRACVTYERMDTKRTVRRLEGSSSSATARRVSIEQQEEVIAISSKGGATHWTIIRPPNNNITIQPATTWLIRTLSTSQDPVAFSEEAWLSSKIIDLEWV